MALSNRMALRAPLLWLLLPHMAGLVAARTWPVREPVVLVWLAALVVFLGLAAWKWAEGKASLGLIAGAAGLLGFIWLPVRSPAGVAWTAPEREAVVVAKVERIFDQAPGRKTVGALVRIVGSEPHLAGLVEQRAYLSYISKISVPVKATGTYRVTGVLRGLPTEKELRGFATYLEGMGIALELVRSRVEVEVKPPSRFRQWCEVTRLKLAQVLRSGLERHPTEASVYGAMLLGEKVELAPVQEEAFMRVGVFHVFSVSGLHVGMMALAVLAALRLMRVPSRVATVLGLVVLWLYVQVTGSGAPAERAFVMLAVVMAAKSFRLAGNLFAALVLAAWLTLWWEPRQLFSAGFQLSYGVVAALVVMGGPLAVRWRDGWRPWPHLPEADWGWWRQVLRMAGREVGFSVIMTWSALLASVPAAIGYFGVFSPGGLLANVLVVPLAGLVMTAGFVSLVAGLVGLGGVVLIFNQAGAAVVLGLDWMVRRAAEVPGVWWEAQFLSPELASVAQVAVLSAMLAGAAADWRGWARWGWPPVAVLALTLFFGVNFG